MKSVNFCDVANKLRLNGRILKTDEGYLLGWENSGVEFSGNLEGEVKITALVHGRFYWDGNHKTVIYVVVDGVPHKTPLLENGRQEITLCTLEKGYHTIRIIKNNPPVYNRITLEKLSFTGEISDAKEDKRLQIEVIGDSIASGAVVMSNESTPADLNLDSSADAWYSFPGIIGREMNADITNVSIPGAGIFHKEGVYGTNEAIIYEYTDYYHNKNTFWDFENNKQDYVIIALGTNDGDFKERKDEYFNVCQGFLNHVRSLNPTAHIIWVYGMMYRDFVDTIKDAVEKSGDDNAEFILLPSDNNGGYEHPGKAAHQVYAETILKAIKK